MKLDLSVDKPVAKVAVRLSDIQPDGSSWFVTAGFLNLTHRNGHAEPAVLVPGDVYEIEVPPNMIARRFKAGHRIRVAISESYWPMIWPSPEAVSLTIHSGVSQLILPERPTGDSDLENRVFTIPVEVGRSAGTPTVPCRYEQDVEGPNDQGIIQARTLADSGKLLINEIGTEIGRQYDWHSTINGLDPTSAVWEGSFSMSLKRDDWDIETKSDFKLTSDRVNFYIATDLTAYEKGEVVFSNQWTETIARDHG